MNKMNDYWSQRAPGYSDVNKEELSGIQHKTWADLLDSQILTHFGKTTPRSAINILDAGAGPGFLSIILTELGYKVTALDYTEAMLEQAKQNAELTSKGLSKRITFIKDDVQNLTLQENTFDVVLSRNLLWNLTQPQNAYKNFLGVLKSGGLMMIFDANWYAYLFDADKKKAYDEDRKNVAKAECGDYNIGENFDAMEQFALTLPLSSIKRPEWDLKILHELNAKKVEAQENAGDILYSEKEKLNYASTPLFMVKAVKD